MTRDSYRVTISREDPWWVAAVKSVGSTPAKKVAELEDMVRDLIMVMRDLDTPDFDLVWDYDLPAKAAEALKDFLRSRGEHEAAERRYLEDAERAAKAFGCSECIDA